MDKEYYRDSEQQIDHLVRELNKTQIEGSYLPIIGDIILRRRFEFGLSDEFFERDINTFIENVKRIEVSDLEDCYGLFDPKKKKIVLSSELFREGKLDDKTRFETIYSTLVHESTHAMNFEENKYGRKQDRAFINNNGKRNRGIMEAFTECEADELVYNRLPFEISSDGKFKRRNTESYKKLTPYIDVIALTFGVERKKLLSEKIKGKENLQNLLNRHINSIDESTGENIIFKRISEKVCLLYKEVYRKNINIKKMKNLHMDIYSLVQEGINERLNHIEAEDVEEFEKQFDKVYLSKHIIDRLMVHIESKEQKIVDTKLLCMQDILENDNITNKLELIQNVQQMDDIKSVMQFVEENHIDISEKDRYMRRSEILREYGFITPNMEWRNYKAIMKHIKENQQSMNVPPEPSKFQILLEKIKSIFEKDEVKKLPENTQSKWWELSEWRIDKEQFIDENKKFVEEYVGREVEEQSQNEPLDIKNKENIK